MLAEVLISYAYRYARTLALIHAMFYYKQHNGYLILS